MPISRLPTPTQRSASRVLLTATRPSFTTRASPARPQSKVDVPDLPSLPAQPVDADDMRFGVEQPQRVFGGGPRRIALKAGRSNGPLAPTESPQPTSTCFKVARSPIAGVYASLRFPPKYTDELLFPIPCRRQAPDQNEGVPSGGNSGPSRIGHEKAGAFASRGSRERPRASANFGRLVTKFGPTDGRPTLKLD
jgi:hypothetical protein